MERTQRRPCPGPASWCLYTDTYLAAFRVIWPRKSAAFESASLPAVAMVRQGGQAGRLDAVYGRKCGSGPGHRVSCRRSLRPAGFRGADRVDGWLVDTALLQGWTLRRCPLHPALVCSKTGFHTALLKYVKGCELIVFPGCKRVCQRLVSAFLLGLSPSLWYRR